MAQAGEWREKYKHEIQASSHLPNRHDIYQIILNQMIITQFIILLDLAQIVLQLCQNPVKVPEHGIAVQEILPLHWLTEVNTVQQKYWIRELWTRQTLQ